jgi:formyltetrahydrofolate deformylase
MNDDTKRTHCYTLRIASPARAGLVAAVTTHLADKGCYINELSQYDDEETRRFFMRCLFSVGDNGRRIESILDARFTDLAAELSMEWRARSTRNPHRVVLMVSRFDHCLRDLLYRWEKKELDMDVAAIVSNHEALEGIAGVPYHYLPVNPGNKAQQERALLSLLEAQHVDLIVLARYMQILSDDLTRQLSGRCINIHHSFLPSFKGASPYAQANRRGVKLIGATAHYVTPDLDEGPIIEQDVRRVDHRHSVESMQALGRDIEARVLAHAVRMHLEDRVFIDGNKTVVFS